MPTKGKQQSASELTSFTKLRKSEAHMREIIAKRFQGKIKIIGEYAGLKNPWHLYCTEHKEHFYRAGGFLRKGAGCSKCKSEKYTEFRRAFCKINVGAAYPKRLRNLHGLKYKLLSEFESMSALATFRCVDHGEYRSSPTMALRTHGGCSECCRLGRKAQSRCITPAQFKTQLKEVNPNIKVLGEYVNKTTRISFQCKLDGYEWTTTPDSVLSGHGCKFCDVRKPRLSGRPKAKEYKLGRRQVSVQGYEPQALDLLQRRYSPVQIVVGKEVPIFEYPIEGRTRRYYPDIFIPDENRIIEVKSTFTLCSNSATLSKIKRKRRAVLRAGYRFNLMVMTPSGSRIKLPDNWHTLDAEALRQVI